QNDLSLYYFSWSEEQAKLYEGWNLSYADRSALDTRVRYSEEEEDISHKAIRCHKSQYSDSDMDAWIELEKADTANVRYFRKLVLSEELQLGF
ncbi:MAG: hypothetical protein AB8H47_10700, partial [Bacteroidia bacterium]